MSGTLILPKGTKIDKSLYTLSYPEHFKTHYGFDDDYYVGIPTENNDKCLSIIKEYGGVFSPDLGDDEPKTFYEKPYNFLLNKDMRFLCIDLIITFGNSNMFKIIKCLNENASI